MDVEEIWIHDTLARFPRAHSFAHEVFHLSAFSFFCSFSKLLVSAFVFMELLHGTTTPFTQRATTTHHLERPVFFCFFEFLMMFNGHSRQPGLYIMSPAPLGRGGRPRFALFFHDSFPCVCVCGLVHIYNVR